MSPLLMTMLIGVAPADAATTDRLELERDPEELYTAPSLTLDLEGLPEPQVAPEDGRWVGTQTWPAGVFLPMALNHAMRAYHRGCDDLPGVFQVQLEQLRLVNGAELAQAVALAVAKEKVRHARAGLNAPPVAETGLPSWLRTTLYVIGSVAAVGVGLVAGWMARGLVGG